MDVASDLQFAASGCLHLFGDERLVLVQVHARDDDHRHHDSGDENDGDLDGPTKAHPMFP
jgi:hypothetical protein